MRTNVLLLAAVVLTLVGGCGGRPERPLSLHEVVAVLRTTQLRHFTVFNGGAGSVPVVFFNPPPRYVTSLILVRVFPTIRAAHHSWIVVSAKRYFPQQHQQDVTVCNVWIPIQLAIHTTTNARLAREVARVEDETERAQSEIASVLRRKCGG